MRRHIVGFVALLCPMICLGQAQTALITDQLEAPYPDIDPRGGFVVHVCGASSLCLHDRAADTGILLFDTPPGDSIWLVDDPFPASDDAALIAISSNEAIDQVYAYERATSVFTRISETPDGIAGDHASRGAHLTPDGAFALFWSNAENFIPNFVQNSYSGDLYVRDMATGTLELVNRRVTDGTNTGGIAQDSQHYDISDDGNRIVFISRSAELVVGDNNGYWDVFLLDRTDGSIRRLNLTPGGQESDDASPSAVSISGNGDVVTWIDTDRNLDPLKTTLARQVFVKDLVTGDLFMASRSTAGTEPAGNADDDAGLAISRDGRFVMFQHAARDLIADDTTTTNDLYAYDRLDASISLISLDEAGQPVGYTDTSTDIYLGRGWGMDDSGRFATFYGRVTANPDKLFVRDRGDIFPPAVSGLMVEPEAPLSTEPITLTAEASETSTGGNLVDSAEYSVEGGAWMPMSATDGAFDSQIEQVEALIGAEEIDGGDQTICVRATDALGWTSRPECLVVPVTPDIPVGLKVRCLHEPLYPQSGETVVVRAETIDQDGNPVLADLVEIYVDDSGIPQLSEPGTLAGHSTSFTASGDHAVYGCFASRNSEQAFSRYVSLEVGALESPDFPALPVIFHGDLDQKIDLVFFPDPDAYPGGPADSAFQADLWQLIRDGLFEIPFFVEFQWAFNVWIATDTGGDVEPRNPDDATKPCAITKPPSYGSRYAFGDAVGYIHQEACRDNAIPGRPFTTAFEADRLQVVAHEIGHKAFSLSDEYTTAPTVRFTLPKFPNLLPDELTCWAAAVDRGKDPDQCRQLFGEDLFEPTPLWIFEPDYSNPGDPTSEIGDLMQQTGEGSCSFDVTRNCSRYRIGDSEEARVFWKLGKCLEGKC